jgi:hypothetical protein
MTSSPRNAIEELLSQIHSGQIEPENFARSLIDQQVFLPVRDEKHKIAGFQRSTAAEPLVVEDEDGGRVMVVFSAPERAKGFVAHYPDFGGGLVTELAWVLRRMGEGMALSLNPGEELGYDFDPEMVAMLVSLLPEEAQ